MKKVLTILVVLTLVAGFAFAAATISNPTVTLTTTVADIDPVFGIHHGITENNEIVASLENNKNVASIAAGDIDAYFVISQDNPIDLDSTTGYSNFGVTAGTAVSLTVTCGNFKNAAATSASTPVISAATYGDEVTGALTYGANPTNGGASAVFIPTYHGKRVDNQTIGTFKATWAQDTDLPFGTYTADITLAFTTV